MKRAVRKRKTYLGRVVRDIERKAAKYGDPLSQQVLHQQLAHRLLDQTRRSTNKLSSIHAPEVECIVKGKARKRYEFGCQAIETTATRERRNGSSFVTQPTATEVVARCQAVAGVGPRETGDHAT